MPILFEHIPGGETETEIAAAVGFGHIRLRGFGYASTFEELGAAGHGQIQLHQYNLGAPPSLPEWTAGFGDISLSAAYSFAPLVHDSATGDGVIKMTGYGYNTPEFGAGVIPLFGYGLSMSDDESSPPPLAGPETFIYLEDNFVANAAPGRLPIYLMQASVAFGVDVSSKFDGKKRALANVALGDDATYVVRLLLSEGIVFSDLSTATFTQIARIISRLILSGEASNYAEAHALVLDAMVMGALAEALQKGEIADTIALNAAVAPYYTLVAQLLERLLTNATATPHYTLTALIEERLLLSHDLSHAADLIAILRDSVGFAATLSIDNGEYIAWVMNTESKGISRYTNYPFNSFAKVGGVWYGASSAGLHRLEGDTDSGEAIHAKIRLGLSSMGGRKLKRIPEAFIGYSSTGTLLMKVITVEEVTGEKQVAIYRMALRGAASTRENRVTFGKGLKSVDWDFVIENVAGADFDLQSIEFRPVMLDRRTRG